ncbi:MAG: hypothetical protein WCH99_19155 [Verrucomicrobiota bacterium]
MKTLGNWTQCVDFSSGARGLRNLHGRRGFCGNPLGYFCNITYGSSASFSDKEYVGSIPSGTLTQFDQGSMTLSGSNSVGKTTGNIAYEISNDGTWTIYTPDKTAHTDYTYRNGHATPSDSAYPSTGFAYIFTEYLGESTPAPVHTLGGGYDGRGLPPGEYFYGPVALEGETTMSLTGWLASPHSGLSISISALATAMKADAIERGIYDVTVDCSLEELKTTITQTQIRSLHTYYFQTWICYNSGTEADPVASWVLVKDSTWTVTEAVDLDDENSYTAVLADCESNLLATVNLLGLSNGAAKSITRDEDGPTFLPGAETLKESWDGSAYVPHSVTTFTGEIQVADGEVSTSCRSRTIEETDGENHLGKVTSSKFAENMVLRAITPYDNCDINGNLVTMEWRELAGGGPADSVVITNHAKAFNICRWPLYFSCSPNGEGQSYNFTKAITKPGDKQWLNIVQHTAYGGYLVDAFALAYSSDPTVNVHC